MPLCTLHWVMDGKKFSESNTIDLNSRASKLEFFVWIQNCILIPFLAIELRKDYVRNELFKNILNEIREQRVNNTTSTASERPKISEYSERFYRPTDKRIGATDEVWDRHFCCFEHILHFEPITSRNKISFDISYTGHHPTQSHFGHHKIEMPISSSDIRWQSQTVNTSMDNGDRGKTPVDNSNEDRRIFQIHTLEIRAQNWIVQIRVQLNCIANTEELHSTIVYTTNLRGIVL